jgi:hypothetical protein
MARASPSASPPREAVLPWLGSSAVVVCHDVVQHNMLDGITTLRARHGGAGTFTVLERTASGMVVFAKPAAPPEARAVLACFHDPVAGIELG